MGHQRTAEPDPARETVSVCIGVYNGAPFIAEAIESSLSHDYPPLEVIVCDNASTDETVEVVSGYPQVELLRHERNLGQSASRNTAIAAARGEFVAMLDADDRHAPGRLRTQVAHLLAHPDHAATISRARHFHETGEYSSTWARSPSTGELVGAATEHAERIPIPSTITFRRESFERHGGYDTSLPHAEDLDFAVRFADRGELLYLDDELVERRIHDTNLCGDFELGIWGIAAAMKRRIERKRAAAASG